MNKNSVIAVFDLDGTITSKDTFLEFIKYYKGNLKFYLGLLFLAPNIFLFFIKIYTNSKLKEKFFSYFFKDETDLHIQKKGDEFSEYILPRLCRKSALDILEWHTKQKHKILILSASADIWLKKWCDINDFELVCTRFEVEESQYTGRILGNNCYGIEKKTLLSEIFSKKDYSYSFGYGDSKADQYFLDLVDKAYLMKLTKQNINKYWSTIGM